jgi:hypothetical protein
MEVVEEDSEDKRKEIVPLHFAGTVICTNLMEQ